MIDQEKFVEYEEYGGYMYGTARTELSKLSEYIYLSTGVNEQLNELLRKGDLHSDDIGFVIELNNIYELLISEADAYRKYIMTKDESYLHIYDDSRVRAWNKIALLLEIE